MALPPSNRCWACVGLDLAGSATDSERFKINLKMAFPQASDSSNSELVPVSAGGLECRVYVDTNAVCAYAINFAWYGELTLTPTAFAAASAGTNLRGRPGRSSDGLGGGRGGSGHRYQGHRGTILTVY